MVRSVVDRFRHEMAVGIEEMQLFALRETELRMLAEVVVERRRAALLRASHDEADLVGRRHGELVSDAQAPVDEPQEPRRTDEKRAQVLEERRPAALDRVSHELSDPSGDEYD